MKKITLFILSALLVFSSVSCSNPDTDETENNAANNESASETQLETAAETIDPAELDELPDDLDFEGASFAILAGDEWNSSSLVEDGYNGTVLNDAIYDMELAVEDKLNVDITETLYSYWDMENQAHKLVTSDDKTYSTFTMMDRFAISSAQKGYFIPYNEVDYIDLDKIYWGGSISDALSIGGRKYFAVGSFNLKSFMDTACIFMNRSLAENHGLEVPFEDVFTGKWTFDKFLSYDGIAAQDIDGDGKDTDDTFTYTANAMNISLEMIIASGETIAEKDENDHPLITIDTNEKIHSVLETVKKTFFDGNNATTLHNIDTDKNFVQLFNEGKALFAVGLFSSLESLREMEDDFAVIPTPKYDEHQENYVSHTYDSMFAMVPKTVEDISMVGAVLESLSCEGYHRVVPAYVETSLQEKYSRDPDSASCIKIAFDTRKIDFAEAFMFDVFGNYSFQKLLSRNELNFASYFQKQKKVTDKLIKDIISEFAEE